MSKQIPYNIWTPQYNQTFGGVRAIYQLTKDLKNRGQVVKINSHDNDSITVYPEIVRDNPFNSDRRVRWLLNDAEFENEVCYSWESEMGNHPLLTVNIIEMNIWKRARKRGKKVAFWVGKGKADPSLIPQNAVHIHRENFPSRPGLAKFISELDYLISFDPFSAINVEATIVGTPVLIHIPEKQAVPFKGQYVDQTWSRERIEKQGWIKYGVAWSEEELSYARETVHLQRNYYLELTKIFDKRIDSFIEETQKIFA